MTGQVYDAATPNHSIPGCGESRPNKFDQVQASKHVGINLLKRNINDGKRIMDNRKDVCSI